MGNNELEKFGTATAWARELGLSEQTVKRRLKDAQGVTGKILTGLVVDAGFYPRSTVYQVCADHLEELPQANTEGFIIEQGEANVCLGTIQAWSRKLGVSYPAITRRLEGQSGSKGKDIAGSIRTFYEASLVHTLCADLLKPLPQADDSGLIVQEQRYATIDMWSQELGIGRFAITRRLEQCAGIQGKAMTGIICTFYPESAVRELCADILLDVSQADSSGFFIRDEGDKAMRYGSIRTWAKDRCIPAPVLRERLQGKGIAGRDARGKLWESGFYSEDAVDEICAALPSLLYLGGLPMADNAGFFILTGVQGQEERYGTKLAWSVALDVSDGTINHYLRGSVGIDGRNRGNLVEKGGFYPESLLRQKCPALFEKNLPQADATGFFLLASSDGVEERYGTKQRWSKELGVSDVSIAHHVQGFDGIIGRNSQGQATPFYAESLLRQRCPQFFEKLPCADEKGFIFQDGVRYGTIFAWMNDLELGQKYMMRIVKDLEGISGRTRRGKVAVNGFFPEPTVRDACRNNSPHGKNGKHKS